METLVGRTKGEVAMSTVAQRFEKFLANIQLTDAQIKDAITKHTGVRETLHNAYYSSRFKSLSEMLLESTKEASYIPSMLASYMKSEVPLDEGYKYQTSLLVGSYGKNTAIAPPSDIDILFELPADQFERYDSYTWNGQSQLLQDIKAILLGTYPRTDIRADGQIVSVPFASYKVEVVPAFKGQDGSYWFPDTHSGGSWKITNPREEMRYLRESNKRSSGNTIKLIKMLKAWKHYCSVPIKSLVIELHAVHFLATWAYFDKSAVYHDWMVRDFLQDLLKYINGSCQIPGIEEKVYYGDSWASKAKSALDRSTKACEYELAGEDVSATMEWKKIFGDRFWY